MRTFIASFGIFVALAASAQQDFSKVQIETQKLSKSIAILKGAGGNIGISYGADGVFIIDDQYAPLHDKIMAAIRALTREPPKFVINTHWHGDHTGGNEQMGKKGSIIVAHENVRKRLSSEQLIGLFQMKVPPSPDAALPVITFNDQITFHLNGDEIHVMHVSHAHTDGDAMVQFEKANILHMGDLFFNGNFPFIDVSSGGSVTGLIAALEKAMTLTNKQSKIIPGHGPMATREDLKAYLDMIRSSKDLVAKHVAAGKPLAEIIQAKPLAKFAKKWGNGFIQEDVFVRILHESLSAPIKSS
ncbi:MAG: MBL fold metallo-hydrolase [Pseudobacteriovorax sp.]|nr:MBL fold metallo-hydrolase [Pseudobacteriovorax sp.]